MQKTFIALYRGKTVTSARLVALSTDPDLVARFADELLEQNGQQTSDPIEGEILDGRRRALELVRDEAEQEADGGEE